MGKAMPRHFNSNESERQRASAAGEEEHCVMYDCSIVNADAFLYQYRGTLIRLLCYATYASNASAISQMLQNPQHQSCSTSTVLVTRYDRSHLFTASSHPSIVRLDHPFRHIVLDSEAKAFDGDAVICFPNEAASFSVEWAPTAVDCVLFVAPEACKR
jgi:hypothetical protein